MRLKMKIKRNILLNPGPATTNDTVKMAQVVPDICPREKEFSMVMRQVCDALLKIVYASADKYAAVLFCGSGTLMMDVCINSLLDHGRKILFINNGVYTERAAEIAEAYNISAIELKFDYDQQPDLAAVENVLIAHSEISIVYTTHQETGTGLLNPIREIGKIAHKYGCWFVVDTTSTLAMLPINIEDDNIDFCMASAQKGIQAMAGLSFVIGNIKYIEQSRCFPRRSYYNNLYLQYEYFKNTGQMRFTPPVQSIYAANQALIEYFQEGETRKWQRHFDSVQVIHENLKLLGFKEYLSLKKQAGLVVTVLYPKDNNWSFEKIHDYCHERGYTIYPGKMQNNGSFILCVLGAIDKNDIKSFFAVFREALKAANVSIPVSY